MSKVLVAISDLMFMSKIEATARRMGAEFERARKGVPLVDEVRRSLARVVWLDLSSPAFGGVEAVRAMRADTAFKDVRVVGYTRHTNEELIEQAKTAGCDEVLTQGQFSSGLAARFKEL